jgi:hypothetical protein
MINYLLKKITLQLHEKNIPYMLSGSMALAYYSIPRMTLDIDIIIELYEENIPVFLSIFNEGYYLEPDTVNEETRRKGMFNAIDHETGYKVDFIVRKNSEYRKLEFSRKQKVIIEGIDVWIVSPEDLVISKIFWIQQYQSEKQIRDIKNLLQLTELDKDYLYHWCRKLQLNTFNLL